MRTVVLPRNSSYLRNGRLPLLNLEATCNTYRLTDTELSHTTVTTKPQAGVSIPAAGFFDMFVERPQNVLNAFDLTLMYFTSATIPEAVPNDKIRCFVDKTLHIDNENDLVVDVVLGKSATMSKSCKKNLLKNVKKEDFGTVRDKDYTDIQTFLETHLKFSHFWTPIESIVQLLPKQKWSGKRYINKDVVIDTPGLQHLLGPLFIEALNQTPKKILFTLC